jgi:hypothetical protein
VAQTHAHGEGVGTAPATHDLPVYVFGIVPRDCALPDDLKGLDDQRVFTIAEADVAAVVQHIDVSRPLGTRAHLLAHSKVLDAVAGRGPVVPVRFGSVLDDAAAVVEQVLGPSHDHFSQTLEGLRGKSQFNLRASYVEEVVLAEVVAEDSEIADLRRRTRDLPDDAAHGDRVRLGELVSQALDRKRSLDSDVLLDTVLPFASTYRVREGGGVDHLLDVALLIADDHRSGFEAVAEDLAATMAPRARLRLLGPLAPYDFVPEN